MASATIVRPLVRPARRIAAHVVVVVVVVVASDARAAPIPPRFAYPSRARTLRPRPASVPLTPDLLLLLLLILLILLLLLRRE
jgi:hypothetical protein